MANRRESVPSENDCASEDDNGARWSRPRTANASATGSSKSSSRKAAKSSSRKRKKMTSEEKQQRRDEKARMLDAGENQGVEKRKRFGMIKDSEDSSMRKRVESHFLAKHEDNRNIVLSRNGRGEHVEGKIVLLEQAVRCSSITVRWKCPDHSRESDWKMAISDFNIGGTKCRMCKKLKESIVIRAGKKTPVIKDVKEKSKRVKEFFDNNHPYNQKENIYQELVEVCKPGAAFKCGWNCKKHKYKWVDSMDNFFRQRGLFCLDCKTEGGKKRSKRVIDNDEDFRRFKNGYPKYDPHSQYSQDKNGKPLDIKSAATLSSRKSLGFECKHGKKFKQKIGSWLDKGPPRACKICTAESRAARCKGKKLSEEPYRSRLEKEFTETPFNRTKCWTLERLLNTSKTSVAKIEIKCRLDPQRTYKRCIGTYASYCEKDVCGCNSCKKLGPKRKKKGSRPKLRDCAQGRLEKELCRDSGFNREKNWTVETVGKLSSGSNKVVEWWCLIHDEFPYRQEVIAWHDRTSFKCPKCIQEKRTTQPKLRDSKFKDMVVRELFIYPGCGYTLEDILDKTLGVHDSVTWRCPTHPDHTFVGEVGWWINRRRTDKKEGRSRYRANCPQCKVDKGSTFLKSLEPEKLRGLEQTYDACKNPMPFRNFVESTTTGSNALIHIRCPQHDRVGDPDSERVQVYQWVEGSRRCKICIARTRKITSNKRVGDVPCLMGQLRKEYNESSEFNKTTLYPDKKRSLELISCMSVGASLLVDFRCQKHGQEFQDSVGNWVNGGSKCTGCTGWNVERIRNFVRMLLEGGCEKLSPAQLHCIFMQSGLDKTGSMARPILKSWHALGRRPLEDYVNGSDEIITRQDENMDDIVGDLTTRPRVVDNDIPDVAPVFFRCIETAKKSDSSPETNLEDISYKGTKSRSKVMWIVRQSVVEHFMSRDVTKDELDAHSKPGRNDARCEVWAYKSGKSGSQFGVSIALNTQDRRRAAIEIQVRHPKVYKKLKTGKKREFVPRAESFHSRVYLDDVRKALIEEGGENPSNHVVVGVASWIALYFVRRAYAFLVRDVLSAKKTEEVRNSVCVPKWDTNSLLEKARSWIENGSDVIVESSKDDERDGQSLDDMSKTGTEGERSDDSNDHDVDDDDTNANHSASFESSTQILKMSFASFKTVTKFKLEGGESVQADNEAVDFLKASIIADLWKAVMSQQGKEEEEAQKIRAFDVEGLAKTRDQRTQEASTYIQEIRDTFLEEYENAKRLGRNLPKGWTLRIRDGGGKIVNPGPGPDPTTQPTLMQLAVASRLKENGCRGLGNWSDTGTGKTHSATLAMAALRARNTVIFCPNVVKKQWQREIKTAFKDMFDITILDKLRKDGTVLRSSSGNRPHVLIVTYSKMSASRSPEEGMANLVKYFGGCLDFVVIDELHKVKVTHDSNGKVVAVDKTGTSFGSRRDRDEEMIAEFADTKQKKVKEHLSKRRRAIHHFMECARRMCDQPDKFRALGLTATPVVNTLEEARSLLQIIMGENFDYLHCPDNPSLDDCMAVHRALVTRGVRFKFDWGVKKPVIRGHLIDKDDWIDLSPHRDEFLRYLRDKRKGNDTSGRKKLLHSDRALLRTMAKVKKIVCQCHEWKKALESKGEKCKILVYTHIYCNGILETLKTGLEESGLNVGVFMNTRHREHSQKCECRDCELRRFLEGDVEVLIGSQAVTTGIDSLQNVCHKMIINLLPNTNSEYRQLLGRIVRRGQDKAVEVFVPMTFFGDKKCSFDLSDWQRLTRKGQIADAAVDGEFPENEKRIKEMSKKYRKKMIKSWKDRVHKSDADVVMRRRGVRTFSPSPDSQLEEAVAAEKRRGGAPGMSEKPKPSRKRKKKMMTTEEKQRRRDKKARQLEMYETEYERLRKTRELFEFGDAQGPTRLVKAWNAWKIENMHSIDNSSFETFASLAVGDIEQLIADMNAEEKQKLYFQFHVCEHRRKNPTSTRQTAFAAAKVEWRTVYTTLNATFNVTDHISEKPMNDILSDGFPSDELLEYLNRD